MVSFLFPGRVQRALACLLLACAAGGAAAAAPATPAQLREVFARTVDRALDPPPAEAARYGALAERALERASLHLEAAQYLVVVDRNPRVQALLLFWRSGEGGYELVGATPVSTGAPGRFDYFETPLGVFEHGPWNPDFRAEGTLNENGIRGYGVKGMRVFDFGWQRVAKGWGDGAVIDMRLQMHATDPTALEPRLGSPRSKGCIRIPATLNRLLDHHGVLDAAYEQLVAEGRTLWVLHPDRETVADAGRYLVVVDSERAQRPGWARLPQRPAVPAQRR